MHNVPRVVRTSEIEDTATPSWKSADESPNLPFQTVYRQANAVSKVLVAIQASEQTTLASRKKANNLL
eukprot:2544-Heterococcus_DN1.PRE.2